MRAQHLFPPREDVGPIGQRVFEQYLDAHSIDWEYETLPGNAQPDYLIHPGASQCIVEVKTVGWPKPWPTEPISPDDPVRRKIKKARPQFREYKNMPCGLALHSATMFGPQDSSTLLAAAFGPGLIASRDYSTIDPNPTFYRLVDQAKLPEDLNHLVQPMLTAEMNRTFSALILLSYHAIDLLHLEVWKLLYAKQQSGLPVEFGDQFNLLNELAPRFDRTQQPLRTPRVIVIENPHARTPFPTDLFRGAFDQRWGWVDGWCGPTWIGSTLEGLMKDGVPFHML